MKKQLLFSCLLFTAFLTTTAMFSQTYFTWYENASNTTDMTYVSTTGGTYSTDQTNPNTGGINANATVTKLVQTADAPFINYNLSKKIATLSGFKMKLKAYANLASVTTTTGRVRVYLRCTTCPNNTTSQIFLTGTLSAGQTWQELTYDFSSSTMIQDVIDAGGFDRVSIYFAQGAPTGGTTTYYIDTIQGTLNQGPPTEAVLETGNIWYHNYSPDVFGATLGSTPGGVFETDIATPNAIQNSSPTVSKFTKAEANNSFQAFELPGGINNLSTTIFKIRVYTVTNSTSTNNNLRMFLRQGATGTGQIQVTAEVTTFNKWVDYTFDFSTSTFPEGITYYDQAWLAFAQPDTDGDATGNVYYLDAFQGPMGIPGLSVDDIAFNQNSLKLYPTQVTSKFETSKSVLSAEVYNLMGQKIMTFGAQKEFDASQLTSGMYLFKAQLDNGVFQTIRFIKK